MPSIYSEVLVRCGRHLSHLIADQIRQLSLEWGSVDMIEPMGRTLRVYLTAGQSNLLLSAVAEFKRQVALIPGAAVLGPERN